MREIREGFIPRIEDIQQMSFVVEEVSVVFSKAFFLLELRLALPVMFFFQDELSVDEEIKAQTFFVFGECRDIQSVAVLIEVCIFIV